MKTKRTKKEQVIFKVNDFGPHGGFRSDKMTIHAYPENRYCIVFFEKGITNEINFSSSSLEDDPVWDYILKKFKQHQL